MKNLIKCALASSLVGFLACTDSSPSSDEGPRGARSSQSEDDGCGGHDGPGEDNAPGMGGATGATGRRLVAEDFDIDELALLQERARGTAPFNFVELGDVSPNSPAEWQRILAEKDAFVDSMSRFAEQPNQDQYGDLVAPDFYNFWNGPIAGNRTNVNDGGPYWDGNGVIPTWAVATKKGSGSGFVACSNSDPNWRCQDAFHYGDDMLSAALVAAVDEDEGLMEDVRRVLLRQTDVGRAPGVDFSNRGRWGLGNQGQGLSGGQEVSSTNPFFFTSLWVVKLAKAYDYTRHRVVDGEVVDNPIYSEADRAQIEGWLLNAGEYFRLAIEDLVLNRIEIYDDLDARIAGVANNNINRAPYRDMRLWDGGPYATYGQLNYQNRITDTAMSMCVVGTMLDEPIMKRDCKLFFKEVIRYNLRPDGSLGDYYRSGDNGERGQHYVSGQLGHLVEMADLFARHGDSSLYDYETSEGSTHPTSSSSSTVGGPKSLLQALRLSARLNRPEGHEGRRMGGGLIDGDTGSGGRRYLQHFTTWARANTYYRDPELAALLDGDSSKGYRGLQHPDTVFQNGYTIHTTKGTFEGSPGELFLHGKKADCAIDLFPFPGLSAPPCL